jgi:plasmid stabilization system protein ParE
MTYEVAFTDQAFEQLEAAYAWWAEHRSSEQAARWYNAIAESVASLCQNPRRCPLSMENQTFPYEIRDLYFSLTRHPTHRVVFTIRDRLVLVLAVRHLAQRNITADEV